MLLLRKKGFIMKNYIYLFTDRLNELIHEQDLTNFSLSKKLNCQDDVIANWRNGKYYPNLKNLLSLSSYFNFSVDYILGLTDDEHFNKGKATETFANIYKSCRDKAKLTDYKVAKTCGFQQSTISKWLLNGRFPETKNLISLSKLFDCSVEFLLGRSDN